ncbi:MAG: hypothetical protein KDA89_13545 [Planctomycetaceae bacterium]|nr:hypothetical protein [Planctomycetaceae bacterium]
MSFAVAAASMSYVLRKLFLLRITRHTTADPARFWAISAAVAVLITGGFRGMPGSASLRVTAAFQYFAVVMTLTPYVHMLGARRPGVRAWPWFVVCPLVLVLLWPAVSQLTTGRSDFPVEIPSPTVFGFLLVLLMGTGNYFGTSLTSASLAAAAGTTLVLLPTTEWMSFENDWAFSAGCVLIAFAGTLIPQHFFVRHPEKSADSTAEDGTIIAGTRRTGESEAPTEPTGDAQLLWADFRDVYGMVWAKRVADRVNQFAQRENWNVRLSVFGFVAASQCRETAGADSAELPCVPSSDIPERSVRVLCWVLRRFVDPPFIAQYLPVDRFAVDPADRSAI